MALNKGISKAVAAMFVVMLLVFTIESVQVEGKMCQKPSGTYKGFCFLSSGCVTNCKSEGYPAGGACVTKGAVNSQCLCNYPC